MSTRKFKKLSVAITSTGTCLNDVRIVKSVAYEGKADKAAGALLSVPLWPITI